MSNQESRRIAINAAWMTIFQVANFLVPIILIPIVTRVLGVESFGYVTYLQTLAGYVTIVVNFGFDYYSTQQIAIHHDDAQMVSRIYFSTIISKLILLSIASILYFSILSYTFAGTLYSVHRNLLAAWLINVGWALYPTWYFLGMEKMRTMSIINFIIKISGALLIIWLVRGSDHCHRYLVLYSLPYVAVAILTNVQLIVSKSILLIQPTIKEIVQLVRITLPAFAANVPSSITPMLPLTLLTMDVATKTEVGTFSGGYKLVMGAIAMANVPLSMSVYPTLSRKFSESKAAGIAFFRRSFVLVLSLSAAISIATYLLAPYAVLLLLGPKFADSVEILRIFAPAPLLCTSALYLTVQGLYAMKKQKFAVIVSLITLVVCYAATHYLTHTIGYQGAAWGYVLAELCEFTLALALVSYFSHSELSSSQTDIPIK